MNVWSWLWVGWLAYFAAVEAVALRRSYRARRAGAEDPRDTLSEHIWLWFGINRSGAGVQRDVDWWARARRTLLGAGLLWLSIHLLTGGYF